MTETASRALSLAAAGLMLVAAGGCVYELKDFGDAVRHNQSVQTAAPDYAGMGQDGVRAQNVLQEYREDVAAPQEIQNAITINVGN